MSQPVELSLVIQCHWHCRYISTSIYFEHSIILVNFEFQSSMDILLHQLSTSQEMQFHHLYPQLERQHSLHKLSLFYKLLHNVPFMTAIAYSIFCWALLHVMAFCVTTSCTQCLLFEPFLSCALC